MKKLIIYSETGDYFQEIVGDIRKSKTKVCYVSLNKSCGYLSQIFNKKGVDLKKIYFVDAITSVLKKGKIKCFGETDFVPPHRLDKISDSIKKAVSKEYNLIIFDSLSNLLDYYSEHKPSKKVFVEFLNSFLTQIKTKNLGIIFILKEKDKENTLIQKILPFFKEYGTEGGFFGTK